MAQSKFTLTSNERFDVIKQSPRQAGLDDIEWLCDEIERLQTQLLEVNKALGLDRDNRDTAQRVKTAMRLRMEADIRDSLDWERLQAGERRALKEEHQPLFDKLIETSEG